MSDPTPADSAASDRAGPTDPVADWTKRLATLTTQQLTGPQVVTFASALLKAVKPPPDFLLDLEVTPDEYLGNDRPWRCPPGC
jgi:hypothetical protein